MTLEAIAAELRDQLRACREKWAWEFAVFAGWLEREFKRLA